MGGCGEKSILEVTTPQVQPNTRALPVMNGADGTQTGELSQRNVPTGRSQEMLQLQQQIEQYEKEAYLKILINEFLYIIMLDFPTYEFSEDLGKSMDAERAELDILEEVYCYWIYMYFFNKNFSLQEEEEDLPDIDEQEVQKTIDR